MFSLVWSVLVIRVIAQKACFEDGKLCMMRNFENVSVDENNCHGFNFRVRQSSIYTVNCQLSNISVRTNITRMKNGPWVYYEDILFTQDIRKHIDKLHAPTSCSVLLKKHPSTPSGMYYINPEGLSSLPLVQIYCNMTSKNGVGVTVIEHDSESKTLVKGYNSPGTYKRTIKYNISMEQIVAIMKQSQNCEQFIKYECYASALIYTTPTPYGWWVSRQGLQMNYWGGAAVDSGKCACGMDNSCAGKKKCNCDNNDKTWREDSGYLIDKNTLPVTELRFGDTDRADEKGYHTLGKLRCWG